MRQRGELVGPEDEKAGPAVSRERSLSRTIIDRKDSSRSVTSRTSPPPRAEHRRGGHARLSLAARASLAGENSGGLAGPALRGASRKRNHFVPGRSLFILETLP